MKMKLLFITLAAVCCSVQAATTLSLHQIQHQWAICQYQQPSKKDREKCFDTLVNENAQALKAHPQDEQLHVWMGINLSSQAGVKGGLGALSLVKKAKAQFEQVIKKAPNTLEGSAYTSLGVLYYQVPGWPIGFGSDKKAKKMLKKGLAMNPNGIDSNYFYADFLRDQGDKKAAKQYFEKALAAPKRPSRPLADAGRRKEILAKLKEL
ncbi:tetratricopeptide repeat protein [Celerinatantimonas diazotrophica]|uniref:Tetratricopeptide repeat protein n=1 Tax=Celerinatantimonas diazotrophica TaxID=412034 RepID=A0A4R1K1G0_9GAMM|nr:hypothetical protein [Celerinatantimonas diazotrophica]TCK57792.1 tetratricopeptide repeat protein [Celerinatantimonas diazotrophica]CAG9298144.1 hypothetical protein CEDIAZO_03339 [Celerinatantimonas diazotrophica]